MKEKRKYADRREYIIKAVTKRRKKIKDMSIEYKGGRCSICGYDKCIDALEFHHEKGDKSFGLSKDGNTRSWDKTKEELDKCILICSNCHRELHSAKRLQLQAETSE